MTKIVWDSNKIKELAKKVETEVGELNTDLKNINTICADLKAGWSGAASSNYYGIITSKQAGLQEIVNKFAEAADGLNKIAATVEQTDANAKA